MMPSFHIHIQGQVQGVGFRPFVYRIALQSGLNGWVSNTTDGVHVEVNGSPEKIEAFYHRLREEAPALSVITGHSLREVESRQFDDFKIVESGEGGPARLLLTPDFALCEDCRRELLHPKDRRAGYPFITCTNCGPRFSIIDKLPYDRERTTMAPFVMCPTCQAEYDDPLNRRYYSQTNSCLDCGIPLRLYDFQRQLLASDTQQIIREVARAWEAGQIVAIKGIGGFLLTCDATHPAPIREWRRRKHRPTKPFALMYPDENSLRADVEITAAASAALHSPVAPIVLLPIKERPGSGIAKEDIAPDLQQIGAMLPYAPLYELLLHAFPKPIIASSGNLSGAPICYTDEQAFSQLAGIADLLVSNERAISTPQDDSVMRFSPQEKQRIILRRSRGLSPTFLPPVKAPEATILATGAELKSSFTLLQGGNYYASQYLGALGSYESQERFRETVEHFLRVFDVQPELLLTDLHPGYFSTQLGKEMAAQLGVPLRAYQHHEAHFAAVLAEHGLLETEEPVLGVIWDGLGLGHDGEIWGGEFFRYQNHQFERVAHLAYFNYSLGDKIAHEPRLSALMASEGIAEAEAWLRPKFTDTEWKVYQKILEQPPRLRSSSVGRIFDAAASLLTGRDKCSFEGEAAMLLEQMALSYCRKNGLQFREHYELAGENKGQLSTAALMKGLLEDLRRGKSRPFIAAKFHCSLVRSIAGIAESARVRKLAFSGGVFQNALLIDMAHHQLQKDYQLYFHRELSPNDENISFGQLVYHFLTEQKG